MGRTLTAFSGEYWIGTGSDQEIGETIRAMGEDAPVILVFDDATGRQVDIDLRDDGSAPQPAVRTRGRPRLGVQAREVTLLPRHWEWLAAQPGGASVTLRKLVETAAKQAAQTAAPRAAQDAAYHFMTAMAGDRPGYEAAIRALYGRDKATFERETKKWPSAVRAHAAALAGPAFENIATS